MRVMPPKGTCILPVGIVPHRCVVYFIILATMKVIINNKEIEVESGTANLAALLRAQGFTGVGQAVAVNNRVVPKADWEACGLEDGMKITVIRAVCGG